MDRALYRVFLSLSLFFLSKEEEEKRFFDARSRENVNFVFAFFHVDRTYSVRKEGVRTRNREAGRKRETFKPTTPLALIN